MHAQMERLYLAAKEMRGLSIPADVARALNQSQQTIKNWESRGMSKAGMLNAQVAIGCSATWLETGEGPMAIGQGKLEVAAESPFISDAGPAPGARPVRAGEDPDTVAVPRVKLRLRAGVAQYDTEPDMNGDGHELVPRAVIASLGLDPGSLIALRVRGESMEPLMFEDDVVIVDRSDTKPISRELYAVNFDGEPCVKQLIYKGGQWYLYSMHEDHGPVNVKSKPCSIVGRVVIQPTRVLTGRL